MRTEESDETGTEKRDGQGGHRADLTDRDKQLVGYLGVARYLSTEQLQALLFPGPKDLCRRRLLRLAGLWGSSRPGRRSSRRHENFEPPYLRRRTYRSYSGELVEVWALSDAGYLLAEEVLRTPLKVPRQDVSAEFLEHSVTLSGLLVGLLDPRTRSCTGCGRSQLEWVRASVAQAQRLPGAAELPRADRSAYALACLGERGCHRVFHARMRRAEELPFRWLLTESTRLPWSEYDRKSGKTFDRVIQPDGVLELGSPSRRLFLECEMGTHSIVGNENKAGATLAKSERYEKFLHGIVDPKAGETFYRRHFPDGAEPEVLYVVTSQARRDSVNAALDGWRKEGHRLAARAVLIPELAHELTDLLAGLPPAASSRRIRLPASASDVRELKRFFNEVISGTKAARAAARAGHAPLPEYPAGSERVGRLLGRFLEELEPSGPAASGGGR
jgi:hypothetical protein